MDDGTLGIMSAGDCVKPRRDWEMYLIILGPWIALGVLEAVWPAIR